MAIKELDNFRQKYPQYNDMNDAALASKLASKYPEYKDLPSKVGQGSFMQKMKEGAKAGLKGGINAIKTQAGIAEGVGGAAAQMGVGMVAQPVAGLAGLARLIHTGDFEEAKKTTEGILQAVDNITPKPRSEIGKKTAAAPGEVFGAIASAPRYIEKAVAPLQDALLGPGASKAIQERRVQPTIMNTVDEIANQLIPMAIVKKRPAPTPAIKTPPVKQTPKVIPDKITGAALDAEQTAILDAFTPGKRKMPELRKGVQPKKVTKVIGLDIDNVLNRGMGKLEPDLVENLNKVLDAEPNAKIVVGSTWRMGHTAESMDAMLTEHGVRPNRVIGLTGDLEGAPRGAEYLEWLKDHGKSVKNFVMLDDRVDMQPFGDYHVKTTEGQGFTPEFADVTIKMLKDPQKRWQFAEKMQQKTEPGLQAEKPVPNINIENKTSYKEQRQGSLMGANDEMLVAKDKKGNDVGRVWYTKEQGGISVRKIEVEPAAQRTGIATELMKEAVKKDGPRLSSTDQTPQGKAFVDSLQKTNPELFSSSLPVGPGAKTAGPKETPVDIIQLQESLQTSPRSPMSERIDMAKSLANKKTLYKSKINTGLENLKAGSAALLDAIRRPPVEAEFKGALGDYLYARNKYQAEGLTYAKEVKTSIPDVSIREGMTNYIEAAGDETILRERLAATKDPSLKKGYEAALKLTEDQKLHADNIHGYFDSMLEQAKEAGILEDGVDNYISHLWDRDSAHATKLRAEVNSGLIKTNPALAKKRILQTYFEGEQLGLKPKTKDASYLVTAYDQAFKEATAARAFVKSLTEMKAKDGRPLAVVSGGGRQIPHGETVPEAYLIRPKTLPEESFDYRPVDHPALRKWKWITKDMEGHPIFIEGDIRLHPEITATFAERFKGQGYYSMNNLFTPSAISKSPIGRLALRGMREFKSNLLTLSGFHQTQVATHAVFHNVNPFKAPAIDLADAVTIKGIKNGLMVTDHSALAEFAEGEYSGSGLVHRIPVLGEAVTKYQEYLFQDYIPRLKVAMFKEAYVRNTRRYPKLNENQVAELTAHQANAAFGELNYRWLGRNKTFQDTMRVLLLAPDFLEARVKFVGQAAVPYGREQLAALLRGSVELYAGARIANMMLNNGDPKWDKWFSVVYNKKEYALRTVPGDIAHLWHDPRNFVYARLNPASVRPMVEWATGRDSKGRKREISLQLEDFIKSGIPIPLQGFMKDSNDTFTESLLTTAFQAIGVNSYVVRSPAERLASIAAGDNVPYGEETHETRETAQLMRGLRKALEEEPKGIPLRVKEAYTSGKISGRQLMNLMQDRDKPVLVKSFERLRIPQQMKEIEKIFDAATPEEKALIIPVMKKKTANFLTNTNVSRQDRLKYRNVLLPYLRGAK